MYSQTTALKKIISLRKRIRIIQGGTSAGKTDGILLYLIDMAQSKDISISVVAESIPHLKRGALRDFLNIMRDQKYYQEGQWNRTDMIYKFETGSYIEFFSADDPSKLRGGRRDVLFINECNNVAWHAFEELEVRTNDLVILDYNPVSEFWVHEDIIPHRDHDFIILTYKDNEALNLEIIKSIESRQHNENWWRVYGLGQVGINEGAIYQNWQLLDIVPDGARLERYGLDFGYSIDPLALVAVYYWSNSYVLDEIIYQKELSNRELALRMKALPLALTIADSAEPKSIEEIHRYGIKIIPSTKGPGSVNQGIQLVQDQTVYITKRSTNIIKEYRNYLWKKDKDGKPLNTPEDVWNHAMDATRYALTDLKRKRVIRTFAEKPALFS